MYVCDPNPNRVCKVYLQKKNTLEKEQKDGAKLVRDAFTLAKEKGTAIIFIDEIDAIGTKRFDSELSGDNIMLALRRDATQIGHEDFVEGIVQVQAKKKTSLNYYA